MSEVLPRPFQKAGWISQRSTVIEAKIHMRTMYRNVGIVLCHLFRPNAKASDLLPWPDDLDKVFVQGGDDLTKRFANRAKLRLRTYQNVVECSVRWVRGDDSSER